MMGHVELAGIGRLDVLRTQLGDQIGVLAGRDGCWIVVYDRDDPDAALVSVQLTNQEAGEIVGLLSEAGATVAPELMVVGTITDALDELAGV